MQAGDERHIERSCGNWSRTLFRLPAFGRAGRRAGMVRPSRTVGESEQQRGARNSSLGNFLRSCGNCHKTLLFSLISLILVAVLGVVAYANSLNGEFLWDDDNLVKDNAYIRDFSNIGALFTKNIRGGLAEKISSPYRPIQMLTYIFDYALWKLDVRGYHITNIILHILTALSIYWLINILYDNRLLSLITSALFVTHPIHTEAISYISGRADPLASLFMILSLALYIKHSHTDKITLLALSYISYTLALLSRENTIILPALILLYHFSFKKRLKPKSFIPVLTIALLYIALRLTALRYLLPHISSQTTILERIPGVFVAITDYIRLLFLPLNLHMEYTNKTFSLPNPKVIIGVILLISLLVYAVRKKDRRYSFCISWFFITLLPSSNLYPINAYMAEHWLYIPSVGFFLMVADALNRFYSSKNLRAVAILIIAAILGLYLFLTIRQNTYWHKPLTFYERTLEYSPTSARLYNNLAVIHYDLGRYEKALFFCRRAIELKTNYASAHYNIGNVYRTIGRNKEAIASYDKALEINPNYAKAYNNLGVAYSNIDRHEEAIPFFEKSLKINPYNASAHNNLGNSYFYLGRFEQAVACFQKAIELNPGYEAAYFNLAMTYFHKGDYYMAVKYCDKAIELGRRIDPVFSKLLEPHRGKSPR